MWTFVKLVLALFARNTTTGDTEPVDKTDDADHALHTRDNKLNTAVGATTDAAAGVDSSGTAIAQLRQLTKGIDEVRVGIAGLDLNTDQIETLIATLNGFVDELEGLLNTLIATDFAAETTLAAFKAEAKSESDETQTKLDTIAANQLPEGHGVTVKGWDDVNPSSSTNALPVTGQGLLANVRHDKIAVTSETTDLQPLTIEATLGGVHQATITLTWSNGAAGGRFVSAERTA